MEKSTPATYFGEVSKLMEQFKLPGLDFAALVEARRKDFAALTEANRIALEGMHSVAAKQAEILRTTLEELDSVMQQSMAAAGGAKPNETVQHTLQNAFGNMRELAEAAGKSRADVFDVVKKRVQENMEELKALLQPRKQA